MKTACIYHSVDLDGFMSAAIVKHWHNKNKPDGYETHQKYKSLGGHGVRIHELSQDEEVLEKEILQTVNEFANPIFDFIGYTYGQPIPDLSGYDKVIMVDISFPMNIMTSLSHNLGVNFIWVDHHISAIKNWNYVIEPNPQSWILEGIRDTNFAACELTWKYFFPNEPMPEIVRLLGRYDCFGGKGTDEWQKILEFQYGARQCISNYEEAYAYLKEWIDAEQKCSIATSITGQRIGWNQIAIDISISGKSIYKYLCNEAKQLYKNGVVVTFPNITILEEEYNFICINRQRFNLTDFGIDYHSEGYDGVASFHRTKEGKWSFSLYNDNGEVDCSLIAKQYGGGGHKGAAGMILTDEQFSKLVN